MARGRSSFKGVTKLRKTLRRIEPEVTEQTRQAMRDGAEAITLDAIARVPKDEGDLARSIGYQLGRDGLTAVIGPAAKQVAMVGGRTNAGAAFATGSKRQRKLSIKNKEALFQFFKGYWIENGTKGSPERNIPPMPARPFMGPAWDLNRDWLLRNVREGINKALEKASNK